MTADPPSTSRSDAPAWAAGLLTALDVAFFLSLLILPLSWLLDPLYIDWGPLNARVSWGLKPVAAPLLLVGLRSVLAAQVGPGGLLQYSLAKKLTLSAVMLIVTVAMAEGVLALIGFEIEMAPVVFELENEEGEKETNRGYRDPELLWKFNKGEMYHGRKINQLGYRDREVDPEKDPGGMRVICLGDSVTAQGKPGYSQYLHEKLQKQPPTTNQWEAFNMAVYGYSSVQGLRVFQRETKHLNPDVVTLFFGWNDHWLEMQTDRNRMAVKTHPVIGQLYNLLKEKRLFMLLAGMARSPGADLSKREQAGFRVPPDEYVEVLRQFVQEIRDTGARPLLITAPSREIFPTKDKHPEISQTLDFGEVHEQYVNLTRQVAEETGADLLDLYKEFSDPSYDRYFMDDGIHFRQSGLGAIARSLHAKLMDMFGSS